MKSPGVKLPMMERHVQRWPENFRKVPGFNGYFIVIHHSPGRTTFDAKSSTAEFPPGASILSTFSHDGVKLVKSWKQKKNGIEYGSMWVSMQNNNGKRKYFKLEELALEIFGERWLQVKSEIQTNASHSSLGELF